MNPRPEHLRPVPPLSDRQRAASARRLALVAGLQAPAMRTIASDDGIHVIGCGACRHNSFEPRHFIRWDQVTVRPAPDDRPRAAGERWEASFDDPNLSWLQLAAGLTDHQAAFAFSENARTEGVDPIERQVICGRIALDDLDDPLMFAAWMVDDPSGWGGGDVA